MITNYHNLQSVFIDSRIICRWFLIVRLVFSKIIFKFRLTSQQNFIILNVLNENLF